MRNFIACFIFVNLILNSVATNLANAQSQRSSILVRGGASVAKLMEKSAAEFAAKNQVSVSIQTLMVVQAIECVSAGTCDIGLLNMDIDDPRVQAHKNIIGVRYGIDASTIATHPGVHVDSLSTAQVKLLFSGDKKNWADFGRPDKLPITLFDRDPNEGGLTKEMLGISKVVVDTVIRNTDEALNRTSLTPGGVTIVGLSYARQLEKSGKVKIVKIDGIEPTEENIKSGKYPYVRKLSLIFRADSAKRALIEQLIEHLLKSRPSTFEKAGVVIP
jgi:phosphate transport system substrate-binding protein